MNRTGRCLLGIDIGTTATKALVISASGDMLADSSRPTVLHAPRAGWAEEDPNEWWENVRTIVPEVLQKAGVTPERIVAIGVSGMVPTLILLDDDGMVLRRSIQQNDARAVEEIEELRRTTDSAEILERTGSTITQQSIGPKLLWLKRHEPRICDRAHHVLGSYDFIVFRLTGRYSAERNWALESGLFDLKEGDWSDDLLRSAGIGREWLGSVNAPQNIVGTVTAEAARECGLAEGTPVIAGTADHVASAFSAGLREEGDLLVKLGGAGDILYCIDNAETDPRLFLDFHLVPDKFLVNGCMASSGSLIRWYREQFAPDDDYQSLDDAASSVPAGADGLIVLPYFLGEKTPINDPLARGTVVGLTLSHTRAHLYRAVLEGIAFGFNHHLKVLAERGHHPTRVRLTNGGAHSALWKQITADVIGFPLERVERHPGSSLGAAFVAGKAVGAFDSWEEIERFITIAEVTEPDEANRARYQQLFDVYLDTYPALKAIYPRLGERVA